MKGTAGYLDRCEMTHERSADRLHRILILTHESEISCHASSAIYTDAPGPFALQFGSHGKRDRRGESASAPSWQSSHL